MHSRQVQKNKFVTVPFALIFASCIYSISNQNLVCAQTAPLRPPLSIGAVSAKTIRSDESTAKKMARYRWLDKMVAADPTLVAAICSHASSARILAAHPHLDKIAEADHYTCRRITKWGSAALILTKNPKALSVVTLDPEGLYRAIKHDRSIARKLTKNAYFDQMIVENPDLGQMLSQYM